MVSDCPSPGKVKLTSLIDAIDKLAERRAQPYTYVKRFYKCGCGYWHFTSRTSSREHQIAMQFPVELTNEGYYAVVVNGKKVWQHTDEELAEQYARRHNGTVSVGWR